MATKPPRAADAPRTTYRVISPLQHDDTRYEVGDEVELSALQAEALLGHTVEAIKVDKTEA